MAPPPPPQVGVQTDEDFFNKFTDGESHSISAEMATASSNLSLGDEAASSRNSGFLSKVEVRSFTQSSNDRESSSSNSSPMHRPDGSKGTSVKEVQWSLFSVDSQAASGLESFSDFLTENNDKLNGNADPRRGIAENSVEDLRTNVGSDEQRGGQFNASANHQATDSNNLQYWENLYPGWKYDMNVGQWYQVDGYDTSTDSQLESYNAASGNTREEFKGKTHATVDGFISDRSDISYLQQAAPSVLETIAEDSETSSVANWNQVSYGSMEYPPRMVFDPQYPGWYYDTNTQQWHSLESYTQAMQGASNTIQKQSRQDANAPVGFMPDHNRDLYGEVRQSEQHTTQVHGSRGSQGGWDSCKSNFAQQNSWQPGLSGNGGHIPDYSANQQVGAFYGSMEHTGSDIGQQVDFKTWETPVSNYNYGKINGVTGFQGFVPAESMHQFNQPKVEQNLQNNLSNYSDGNQNAVNHSSQQFQDANASYSQFSSAANVGRSSAGRPPHPLVSFGFGGKLIVMKNNSYGTKSYYGNEENLGSAVSILSLSEVVMDKVDASSIVSCCGYGYFRALCRQSFPGPLVGSNAAAKDVNKWIDERIMDCESPNMDFQKGKHLRLLFSLLKISCQHYGKLRSPFGADSSLEETDGPESAVTKLFASARNNSGGVGDYGSSVPCMQNFPLDAQMQATAAKVQNLLVSGRRKEALQCAQEGQLWGPALVLAAQLGDKFYIDVVRQMARRQFISGSPLRTLCLLIAGQPADVFSADSLSGAANTPQQASEILATGMLDDWEENLAIITANRTKDDELVMVHLGDCLWKERGEITAAHTCYLVAEANFNSYSDTSRLCLIGSDHWKYPRTYASPEAIQRTEVYEYSKVLGNSQFILLPFQPYKMIYAYMLAEVGKVSDSLRYCQASLKLLKNSIRSPEVESWKLLLSSLEDRLRTHQQGGYSTNLDPAKFVGKLFTSIDRSIHRIIGAPPSSSLPPEPQSGLKGGENYSMPPKVVNSQSTMAMSSLIPSASEVLISDGSRKTRHSRSVSEPTFGKQDASSVDAQSKGQSRFGRISSHLFQRTIGWVSRSRTDSQAKLGERNKFYYDEKLKRWVEEGVEPPAEEAALPPPPIAASFQNGTSDHNINSAFKTQILSSNGGVETKSIVSPEHNSGIPPIPPSQNQFSARGRTGVRSRYVDTLNKGSTRESFHSPSASFAKPALGAKFFVPTPDEELSGESKQGARIYGEAPTSVIKDTSLTSSSSMQRFPSMDNINTRSDVSLQSGSNLSHTRAASWSGVYTEKHSPSPIHSSSSSSLQLNGGSLMGDELHEVEL